MRGSKAKALRRATIATGERQSKGWVREVTAACSILGALAPISVWALPQDGTVAAGSATISTPTSTTMRIDQNTDRVVIDWARFNIAANEGVRFQQPSAASIALNRVAGYEASGIFGSLSANGQIIISNPSGILFGPSSRVDVGALTATTLNITNQDFLAGQYRFTQDPAHGNAAVVNQGIIAAGPGGYVALLGAAVSNEGLIQAQLGTVALGAAKAATLDMRGDGKIGFVLTDAVSGNVAGPNGENLASYVSNTGTIRADGGTVTLTARAATDVIRSVVNHEGIIEARSLEERNGQVFLNGGDTGIVSVSGTVDASGAEKGQTGGTVQVVGDKVGLFGAHINVAGDAGGGTVLVGGDYQGHGTVPNATRTYVSGDSTITADALTHGNGGKVVVWADDITRFYGSIFVRGGAQSGNGGFVETSGKRLLDARGYVDASAPFGSRGEWLLDPHNITVATGGGAALTAVDQFTDTASTDATIAPATINAAGANVVLQANNDITFTDAVSISTAGVTLTAQAGRSILVNNNITTNNAAITLSANETTANGVQNANRDAGTAAITMATGKTINAGNANITMTMHTGAGLTNSTSGNITLENLTTTGHALVVNNGPTAGSSILRASANSLVTASSAALDVNGAGGGGGVGVSAKPIRLAVTNAEAHGQSAGVFLTTPSLALNIGGATLGGLTGISTSSNGAISVITSASSLTTSEAVAANGSGTVTLTLAGASSNLTIGAAVTSGSGAITLSTPNNLTLTGSASVSTTGTYNATADNDSSGAGTYTQAVGSTVSNATVGIRGADVDIQGTVDAGINAIYLRPTLLSESVGVEDATKQFKLSNAELSNLTTTDKVTIGLSSSGVVMTGAITLGTDVAITQTKRIFVNTTGDITVGANGISTSGGTLTLNTLAGGSGNIVTNGPVATTAGNFNVVITTASGSITTNGTVVAGGSGTVTLTAAGAGQTLTVANAVTSGTGSITLTAPSGISLSSASANISTGGIVTFSPTAGGVTQTGGSIIAPSLRLTGAGTFSLTSATNDVTTLAANVTGAVSYTDATTLTVGTVSGTNGITTNNNNATIATVNGPLTVANTAAAQDLNAGTGTVSLTAGGTNKALTITGAVTGTGGVTYTADNMTLTGATTATGAVATLQPNTAGTLINLGGPDAAGTLGLTSAELNTITAGTLHIGNPASGAMTVSANIAPTGTSTLSLESSASMVEGAGAVTIPNLALRAPNILMTNFANSVGTLAVSASGVASVQFFNGPTLAIGTVDGVAGVSAVNGSVRLLSLAGGITVNDTAAAWDVDGGTGAVFLNAAASNQALTVTGSVRGGTVNYTADNMTLTGATTATGAVATLKPSTGGTPINLGGADAAGTLGLTSAELNTITAGTLRIGNASSGNISISSAIAPTGTSTLSLITGGTVTQTASVTVTNLDVQSAGAVTLTNGSNDVSTLAANVSGAGNAFTYTDTNALTVGTVDGVTGISTNNGNLTLNTGNTLTFSQSITAGTGTVTAIAGGTITLNGTVSASGGGDSITLVAAGGNFINNAGATALNPGAGRWLVYSTTPASDNRGGLVYNFKQYNATYGVTVLGTGNGFLYTTAPSITPSLTGTVTKVYDGTTTATLTAGNYAVSGTIDGDTVTLNNPSSGSYDTRNVGINKNVSVSGLSISSATDGAATVFGYQLASTTANANIGTITARPLTLTALTNTKTYDGTTTAAATPTVAGLQVGDSVTGLAEAYADKNAGINKTLSVSTFTVNDGNSGNNYTVSTVPNATGVINQAGLTISAVTNTKTYDGTTTAAAATPTVAGLQTGDTVTGLAEAYADKNVLGTNVSLLLVNPGLVVNDANGGANYTLTLNTAAGTITPAGLTVTANNQSKPFATTFIFNGTEFTPAGLQNGETIGTVTLTSAGTPAAATVAGSPYPITASSPTGGTFAPGNYSISFLPGALTVTPGVVGIVAAPISFETSPLDTSPLQAGILESLTTKPLGPATLLSSGILPETFFKTLGCENFEGDVCPSAQEGEDLGNVVIVEP